METPKAQPCPKCGVMLDGHTPSGTEVAESEFEGTPFHASICAYCTTFFVVQPDGTFRAMTFADEMSAPKSFMRQLYAARAVLRLRPFPKRGGNRGV